MRDSLREVLESQRRRGLLGPAPVDAQIEHALAVGRMVSAPRRLVDLGSGGGIPGLVLLALLWPQAQGTLLDASQRRCTYLELCVMELRMAGRVAVHWARAEDAGRDPLLRGRADLVLARSFGPPAVTAECAAPLLVVGGTLAVSEPPGGDPDRWPEDGLANLGLSPASLLQVEGTTLARMTQDLLCPERFPRRAGVPARAPLF